MELISKNILEGYLGGQLEITNRNDETIFAIGEVKTISADMSDPQTVSITLAWIAYHDGGSWYAANRLSIHITVSNHFFLNGYRLHLVDRNAGEGFTLALSEDVMLDPTKVISQTI